MKRNLFHFKYFFLWKRRKEEEELIRRKEEEEGVEEILKVIEENENRKRAISPFVYTKKLYRNSTYCSGSPFTRKIRIKRIELPTHYSEVNHRTLKAVVSYGPNIGHIPHDIRLKDPNLPLRSGNGRGQNI
jgi:small subunit ribosomal protein S4